MFCSVADNSAGSDNGGVQHAVYLGPEVRGDLPAVPGVPPPEAPQSHIRGRTEVPLLRLPPLLPHLTHATGEISLGGSFERRVPATAYHPGGTEILVKLEE
jgi:hypothetical protein